MSSKSYGANTPQRSDEPKATEDVPGYGEQSLPSQVTPDMVCTIYIYIYNYI